MDLGHFGCCWAVVLLSFHFVHPVHVITAASYSSQNHSRVATGAQTPWRTKMDRFGSRRLPNSRMVPSHPIRMSTTANPNKIVTKEQPTIRMSQVQHGHTSKPASMEFTASIISYHRLWKDPTNTTTTAHLDRKASDTQPDSSDERKMQTLLLENANVKLRLKAIENENFRLHKELSSNRLVLETFENGEGQQRQHDGLSGTVTATFGFSAAEDSPQGTLSNPTNMDAFWCDVLDDDDSCPIEPMVSFVEAVRDRSTWLVGLLILQSGSGFILAQNEALLANHPFLIYFLTMLVGAGGNAGNQASVRVIRGLALGTLNAQTQNQFLMREFKMAGVLSVILPFAGFVRAAAFGTPFPETVAVTASLTLIVFSSVCLGAILPQILKRLRIVPAHSSTSIQVVMDILGVILAVFVSRMLLDSTVGGFLIQSLGG